MKTNDLILAVTNIALEQGKVITEIKPIVGYNLVDGVETNKIYFAEKISAKGFGSGTSYIELRHGLISDLTDFEKVKADTLTGGLEKEYTDVLFNSLVVENVYAFFKGWEFTTEELTID